ncbi:MAG TPA: VOC family protein [Pseudonocardiaceae bacterium]|jgi:predicted enzyme related to lactoylglutathione lyase
MPITLSHCFVYVLDQDEALRFYTGPLGLEVRTDARMEQMRWLTVGPPKQPEVEIGLLAIGPPVPPAHQDTIRDLVAKGSLSALIFATDDCRATFERVRDSGAEVLQEPIEQPYGVLDCAFRDPSGNMVRFSQPLAR